MDTDSVKIKCPYCRAVLAVRKQPGLENKNVTCPVCEKKSPFSDFEMIVYEDHENTVYPGASQDSGKSEISGAAAQNYTLGVLTMPDSGLSFRLKTGRNIIGRKADTSSADIQIPVADNKKRLSRNHLVVDVKKVSNKGFVHQVSLYKKDLNATYINGELLEFGDCVIIKDGDILELPDVRLKFRMPDIDETER